MQRAVDAELLEEIKQILRRDLKLGAEANIRDDMPLVGGDMDLDSLDILLLVPVAVLGCLVGGSFGLLGMSVINDQRAANQIFGFILLPQFFLAGVFNPINVLPWYLEILSLISPLRYVVDLFRGVVYMGRPEYHKVVLLDPEINLMVMALMFAVFIVTGTALFVRRETNR